MIKVEFKDFTIDDYDILVDIWEKAGLSYKPQGRDSKERIAKELEFGIAEFILAYVDDSPVGVVLGTHDGRKGWINRVAVVPEYRKHGVAMKLIEEAERRLNNKGIDIVAALVEEYNTPSMELLKKAGYIEFEGVKYFTKRKNKNT